LHTNDAPSSLLRLRDLGIDNNLLSSSLLCVLAQRLVRKICPACKKPQQPDPKVLEELKGDLPEDMQFYQGQGCEQCHGLGYRGQTGIFELLSLTDELRILIQRGAAVEEIRDHAHRAGMQSLRAAGIRKVWQGVTTLDEVIRVTV